MEVVRKKMQEIHFSQNALKKMAIDREYKGVTDQINNEVNRQVLFIYFFVIVIAILLVAFLIILFVKKGLAFREDCINCSRIIIWR